MSSHLGHRTIYLLVGGLLAATAAGSALGDDATSSWYDRAYHRVETTWKDGQPEFFLPLHTTHLRSSYTREQIDRYNENPWGLGLGRGLYDQDGDWHGLYLMGFKDSHFKPEYVAGYGYRTFWTLLGDLKFGLGYNAFITTRSDIGHYAPIPLVLPAVSLAYGKFSVETIYLPGTRGAGNILFFYGRIPF